MEKLRPTEQNGEPTMGETVAHRLDMIVRPVRTAAFDALTDFSQIYPEGDQTREKIMQMMPDLMEDIKTQDRLVVLGSFLQASVLPYGLILAGGYIGNAVGVAIKAAELGFWNGLGLGAGVAYSIPSFAQAERARIMKEATKQKMLVLANAANPTGNPMVKDPVDAIVDSIKWGTT